MSKVFSNEFEVELEIYNISNEIITYIKITNDSFTFVQPKLKMEIADNILTGICTIPCNGIKVKYVINLGNKTAISERIYDDAMKHIWPSLNYNKLKYNIENVQIIDNEYFIKLQEIL